jgi:hypothetical protein
MTMLHSCFSENNGLYMVVHPDDYRRVAIPNRWESEESKEAKKYVVRCAQATRTHFLTVEQMKRHYNWIIRKAFPYRVISPVSTEARHMIWKLSMKNIPRRIQLLVNLLSAHLLR